MKKVVFEHQQINLISIIENEIVPVIGGGAHYTFYTKALHAVLNSLEECMVTMDNLTPKFKGVAIGNIFLNTILNTENGKEVVIITSNSSIIEKDREDAKRIIRFSEGLYFRVILINVDWYGDCTHEIINTDY